MRIAEIIWLEEIVEKLRRKHGLEPEEVEQALAGRPYFFFAEKGHRKGEKGEDVFGAFGRVGRGKVYRGVLRLQAGQERLDRLGKRHGTQGQEAI